VDRKQERAFEEFVGQSGDALLRLATLLTFDQVWARTSARRPCSASPHAGRGWTTEIRPALLAALRALAPQQRAVVVLRYFDDRSENEIAELLGVSAGTVKSTASRALVLLRQQPGISGLPAATNDDTERIGHA
jgi:DNA-binding CsgD family transcriptional regulator